MTAIDQLIELLKKELERLQNCYDILYKKYIEK